MQINAQFIRFDFNESAFRRLLDQAIQAQLRLAARAWLRALLTRVPSWTGQARGSLQPIGRYVGLAVPISVSSTAPGDRSALGQARSNFQFNAVGALYTFTWETHVPHYLINEYFNVPLPLIFPTPWHSLDAGEAAFMQYVTTVLPNQLPQIRDHIIGVVV